MIQATLDVYRIDMKYIRNLHNIDDRVLSISPRLVRMSDKIDFKKIVYHGELIGALNFKVHITIGNIYHRLIRNAKCVTMKKNGGIG